MILAPPEAMAWTSTLAQIRAASQSNQLLLVRWTWSSLASIRAFASGFCMTAGDTLLVNNAAVCGLPTTRTPEGLDVTFATNYIGPFLLTNLLQDLYYYTPKPHVAGDWPEPKNEEVLRIAPCVLVSGPSADGATALSP
ncbi:Short-chain dehydrogenase TIC 32; chloroplastic [Camelus dromedarius]|uniref:Short-chain dehydrogenase TIC 32 n=1 Tax=Camelus dromedarius TaxID=9838 RepID=A0A5N4D6N6_CAMDR|nr:Short-chain dehydrogenase TIC 32; chloroplastic [Camelus dromedarius]